MVNLVPLSLVAARRPVPSLLHRLTLGLALVGSVWAGGGAIAQAIPGQTVTQAEGWIRAHPTLRPAPNERLTVRKSETAARRFIFQASQFGPGQGLAGRSRNVIRSERITLFDMINGVTVSRLEEAIRVIYGADVYSDFQLAERIYTYPNSESVFGNNPSVVLAGELRQGERFGYWLETASNPAGVTYTGRVTVLLLEDVPGLRQRLVSTVL